MFPFSFFEIPRDLMTKSTGESVVISSCGMSFGWVRESENAGRNQASRRQLVERSVRKVIDQTPEQHTGQKKRREQHRCESSSSFMR